MSFADIEIKKSYKTNSSNIVQDFYLPVLSEAVLYKRAVGFFTSGALIELSKGCLLYTSPSPRDSCASSMPSSE